MNNKVLIALILILGLLCAFLGYKLSKSQDSNEQKEEKIEVISEDRERVQLELEKMAFSYDTLMVDNQTLSSELIAEREKVEGLLQKVKNKDYSLYSIRKEAETLRGIMKGYVHTIDSLNTVSEEQQAQIAGLSDNLSQVSQAKNKLEEEKADLEGKIEQGSVLQAGGVASLGIRIKSSGKQVETDRASRTEMVKTCFVIRKNTIAPAGNKNIYVRIIGPSGQILPASSTGGSGTFDGQVGNYNVSRTVDYQNAELDLCMFYTVQEGTELSKGNYTAMVYEGDKKIGQTSFALK